MNNERDRIQFDWSKYETSDYEVICRDGSKPKLSGFNPDAHPGYKIIGWSEGGIVRGWFENGNYLDYDESDSDRDLFLIPKQKQPEPTPESDLIDFDYEKFKTGDYDLVELLTGKTFKLIDYDENRDSKWKLCGEINRQLFAWGPDEVKMRKKKNKYQAWVNLYPSGVAGVYYSKQVADNIADPSRIECRLIEWEA